MRVFNVNAFNQIYEGKILLGFLTLFSSAFIIPFFFISELGIVVMIVLVLVSMLYARLFMFNKAWDIKLKELERNRLRSIRNARAANASQLAIVTTLRRIITLE